MDINEKMVAIANRLPINPTELGLLLADMKKLEIEIRNATIDEMKTEIGQLKVITTEEDESVKRLHYNDVCDECIKKLESLKTDE